MFVIVAPTRTPIPRPSLALSRGSTAPEVWLINRFKSFLLHKEKYRISGSMVVLPMAVQWECYYPGTIIKQEVV